jgi:hypothetical protein
LSTVISYVIREADGLKYCINFINSANAWERIENLQICISVKESSPAFYEEVKRLIGPKDTRFFILLGRDGGFDIGTHLEVAKNYPSEVIIWMSASSIPTDAEWISKFIKPFTDPNVGAVGTMQSAESHRSNIIRIRKLQIKNMLKVNFTADEDLESLIRSVPVRLDSQNRYQCLRKLAFSLCWTMYSSFKIFDTAYASLFLNFRKMPNYHLRTTGIAFRTEYLNSSEFLRPKTKLEAYILESGYRSVLQFILNEKWEVKLLFKDGTFESFPSTHGFLTFRSQNAKSLVLDSEWNRFFTFSAQIQDKFCSLTHGQIKNYFGIKHANSE